MEQNEYVHSRRRFLQKSMMISAALVGVPFTNNRSDLAAQPASVCLGGPVFGEYESPDQWVDQVQSLGYRAAYCPVGADTDDATVQSYARAAEQADIVIAEVGAWSNPISPDEQEREMALDKCRRQLHLADRIGANCCVNISGSRGLEWAGPHPENLTEETFEMIVETTRSIIDDVKPLRTYFALETMPWAYPDSPDAYLRLIEAIDRDRFAAHLDPVNLVCSPRRYFSNGALIKECFRKFGPYIRSCHAKDILLDTRLTTHLDEVRPGIGELDYEVFLLELSKSRDVPLMLEHLDTAEQYHMAADYIRSIGANMGLSVSGG